MRTVHFSWEAPTTRNGGAPIGPAEISGYELQVTKEDEAPIGYDLPATALEFELVLENGGYYVARVRAIDSADQAGLWSNPSDFTVADPVVPPLSPPGAFVVELL